MEIEHFGELSVDGMGLYLQKRDMSCRMTYLTQDRY
jgi:hypothetical protein